LFAGENAELKQALNSTKKSEKRDAVKKVIASMTVGKDVRSVRNRFALHALAFAPHFIQVHSFL
jgi:hypothetical protein